MPLTELHVPCDLGGHGDLGGHVPRDLGGHVPKVEVVGDHRIVSNQRVRLKLRACESFQEKIFSDQTRFLATKLEKYFQNIYEITPNIFGEI